MLVVRFNAVRQSLPRQGRRFRSASHNVSPNLPKPRLDYRRIRDTIPYQIQNIANRKALLPEGTVEEFPEAWDEFKEVSAKLNIKRNERASLTARIASASTSGQDDDKSKALKDAKVIKETISDLEFRLAQLDDLLLRLALPIPNHSHPLSPVGSSASILSTHGPPPTTASNARDHVTIGRALDLIDFEAGALATGSSWYYLTHEGALLEMALINYALSVAIEHGFTPVTVPDVVRAEVAAGCGFNPRDNPASQIYHVTTNECTAGGDVNPRLVLAGTAEIPLAALFANKILSSPSQPSKVVGVGRAFRAEAGARGANTKGLYRVHQFTKVELFAVTHEDNSDDMMEEIRTLQVRIFEGLGIPFRVLEMPTEELGASAYRKYDMEAWMPGRGEWGEISSTSNCTDYQSRRLHIRYRNPATPGSLPKVKPTSFAHTLNGTALAVPRIIIALLENGAHLDGDGAVVGLKLPSALKPFWIGGTEGRNIIHWS